MLLNRREDGGPLAACHVPSCRADYDLRPDRSTREIERYGSSVGLFEWGFLPLAALRLIGMTSASRTDIVVCGGQVASENRIIDAHTACMCMCESAQQRATHEGRTGLSFSLAIPFPVRIREKLRDPSLRRTHTITPRIALSIFSYPFLFLSVT